MCSTVYTFNETYLLKFTPQHISQISCPLQQEKTYSFYTFIKLSGNVQYVTFSFEKLFPKCIRPIIFSVKSVPKELFREGILKIFIFSKPDFWNKVKYKIDHFPEIRTNYLFLIGALVDEIKCEVYVLGKSRSKHILISPKLMSRLSYYRIYDVQSRYLVLWPTL